MDEEIREEEKARQQELLEELQAEVEAIREEISDLNEPTAFTYDEPIRPAVTHFMKDLEDGASVDVVQDAFVNFVKDRHAQKAEDLPVSVSLPDSTDLIVAKYGDCLKFCYLLRVDGFNQPKVPDSLDTLIREEDVGGKGEAKGPPKMAFIFWDNCTGEETDCACESITSIGEYEWDVVTQEGCKSFNILTSVSKEDSSGGTQLKFKEREIHIDKCGKVLKLGPESDVDITVPCCDPTSDLCPEENNTYTLVFKTWTETGANHPLWSHLNCRKEVDNVLYRPYRGGTFTFTRATGLYTAPDINADAWNREQPNWCTSFTETATTGATLSYDSTNERWNVDVGSFFAGSVPGCSPIITEGTGTQNVYYTEYSIA